MKKELTELQRKTAELFAQGYSYGQIGRMLGGRCDGTVNANLREVARKLGMGKFNSTSGPDFKAALDSIDEEQVAMVKGYLNSYRELLRPETRAELKRRGL